MNKIIYPKVTFWDITKSFWKGMKPQKWLLFFIVSATLVINIISVITPLFYKKFFDIIANNSGNTDVASQLITIIIYVAMFHGVLWVFYRLHGFCNISFQNDVIVRLKQQAYDYLIEHSYSFFTNNFTGSLVQRVSRFGRAFERLADRIMWDMFSLAIKVVSIIIIVYFINPWIALIILAWATTFLLFNIIFSIWKIRYDFAVAEIDSKTTAYLADTITNQNTVLLFNRFGFESAGYKKITNEQSRITKFNWNLVAMIEAVQSFLGFSIEIIVFYFAIKYWQKGLVTVGFFVLLQVYILYLIDQLWVFTRIIKDVYQSYADAKEMVEIMMLPHEIKDIPKAKELAVKRGEIEFSELNFSFNETRKVLENINLIIGAGERGALIGPSGAGKTTFVKLLLRLYSPTSGKIMIDGKDIQQVTQDSLRKSISMVPQDPVLFHRTLTENIAYGKLGASKKEITNAVKLAHCDEFIKNLPDGLDTYVGERGIKLSGGERQRVAIARAILKNAPILILDEATSSLDSHSEMLIQDALSNLMQGKTTIVIAHRLSTIQKMDRIIVIEDGRIIEEGSHNDLLAKQESLYKKLWTLQAGGFLTSDNVEENEENSEDQEDDDLPKNSKIKFASF